MASADRGQQARSTIRRSRLRLDAVDDSDRLSFFVGLARSVKSALDHIRRRPKSPCRICTTAGATRAAGRARRRTETGAGGVHAHLAFATGTGILLAAIVAGFAMGFSPVAMLRTYARTLWRVRFSLLTIAAMLALGYVTTYSGTDATLGLALARTGALYPFFGTLLGWLGVALTGSDTASNVLFGSLQKITAEQLGIEPDPHGAPPTAPAA